MSKQTRDWHNLGGLVSLYSALAIAGCASGGMPPPVTTVRVAPAPQAAETALPELAVAQISEPTGTVRRIERLDMVEQDLRTVLVKLAENFGLDHQIDPGVSGLVTQRMSNVSLEQALDQLVIPYGYQYQLQGNVLRVVPVRMATRMFTLDYVSLSRTGVGSTVAQTSLSSGAGSAGISAGGLAGGGGIGAAGGGVGAMGGVGGGAGGGAISSITVADFWAGVQVALEGLIFGGGGAPGDSTSAPVGTVSSSSSPGGAGGGAIGGMGTMGGSSASSMSGGGQRLIIDPFAGLITVTASPETLASVEAYIIAIERSIQRQVLIEAKIIEVRLDRSYEFGIDWSLVRNLGGVTLSLGANAGGADLTLSNSDDVDGAINIVLRALQTQGDVNVLSSPRVTVLNNQPATFQVTTNEVFFNSTRQPITGPNGGTIGFNTQIIPQQIAVGITLDVLAQISAGNVITMGIRPSITEVVEEKTLTLEDGSQASAPVIASRNTDTMVRVRDGETIVIGGLMQSRLRNQNSGVPFLRDIPLIGALFRGRTSEDSKSELVIFITPTIVAGEMRAAN